MKKRYRVLLTDEAKKDFDRSFQWGRREWGETMALGWYRDIKLQIQNSLPYFPLSHPVAPESDELGFEIRQMILDRYRVLFEIVGNTVRILHLRGAYVGRERPWS